MLVAASAISFIVTLTFLVYVFMIIVPFVRRTPDPDGRVDAFAWHIFVPCRDEEVVISRTIRMLRSTVPEAHVWVIDDDSDDRTASIVQSAAEADAFVHLVQRRRPEARTGKGDALNAAYFELNAFLPADTDRSRVVVCVVDADGEVAENILRKAASPHAFGDPEVGAAQVTVYMKNRDDRQPVPGAGWARNTFGRFLIRMQDLEFRGPIAAIQSLRGWTETVGLGGNGQFTRLSVLDDIAARSDRPWHGSLLEDYELGIHVLLAGHKNRHLHDTYVAQEALHDFRRFTVQRTRWAQGNMQCIRYIPEIVRSPMLTNAGILEICYYLLLPVFQVVASLAAVTLVVGAIVGVASGAFALPWSLLPVLAILFLLFGIGPFFIWGPLYRRYSEPDAGFWTGILWGFGMWVYDYYVYLTGARALYRIVRGRNGWAKTRRNGEIDVAGPIAKDA
ncbi:MULTISPECIES: glycosyltransferase [Microbacterium]|uniref:glycosyltransferase n=1 Tax=Microbacterium TaxID=33882 RepID=UPI000B87C58B|nr:MULTISPECIES: glycosyltransferase [Microbacterium]NJI58445.1 glycosyltransferase [Microbacterium sp. B19(2022)]